MFAYHDSAFPGGNNAKIRIADIRIDFAVSVEIADRNGKCCAVRRAVNAWLKRPAAPFNLGSRIDIHYQRKASPEGL